MGEYHHHVRGEFTPVEGIHKILLRIENPGGCLDTVVFFLHGRCLYHCTTEITLYQSQAAMGIKRIRGRSQYAGIQRLFGDRFPGNCFILQHRFTAEIPETRAHDGLHVIVQETGVE